MKSTVLPLLVGVMIGLTAAQAELLIYELDFNSTQTTVNYGFVQDAYAIVDLDAGSFSTVFVLSDPNTASLYYTTSLLSGSYFRVTSAGDGDRYAVLTGQNAASENVAMQLTGPITTRLRIGGNTNARVATGMRGVFFASSPDTAASQNATAEVGFAGQSRVGASLNRALTRSANNAGQSAGDAAETITDLLENLGIGPQPSPSPSPTPSPSPSPTSGQ